MIRGPIDLVRPRLVRVRAQIDERLAEWSAWTEIEPLLKELDALEKFAQRRRRRLSLRWVVGAMISAVSLALLLHLLHLRQEEISFVAATRAVVIASGASTQNVLAEALPVREIMLSAPDLTCVTSSRPPGPSCEGADIVQLNTLVLNARSAILIRASAECIELQPFEGGASATITRRARVESARAGTNEGTGVASWRSTQAVLGVGESLRFCPAEQTGVLQMPGPVALVTADRTFGGAAERQDMPALLTGALAMTSTERRTDFRQTDVVHLRGLTAATVVASLGKRIDLTLVGRARDIKVSNGLGSDERSLMPSVLEWLYDSRAIRWAVGLIGALLGPLLTFRNRFLAEDIGTG